MANILQPVRGTRDLIGEDAAKHTYVVETARRISSLYGFSEWQTPIFEDTRVFARTLGETSDVVTKEMYTFEDRGGDSITLRPEGTAGVCRALITKGLTQTLPQKVFYQGPMFRYERPQKGRYRQFHQIGVELLGTSSPLADAEVIACGWRLLQELGISEDVVLQINTLGDAISRELYKVALVNYFTNHESDLSEQSKIRLEKNPLRILDSKDDGDIDLCANAPVIYDHLTDIAESHFSELQKFLRNFDVPFEKNPRIVRGLDYYNHTAFEFVTTALGAQGTVLAGGRYDGLVEQMGGPSVPGVGWAAGIDRLALLLDQKIAKPISVVVIPHDDAPEIISLNILKQLRQNNIVAELGYSKSAKNRLEKALKSDVRLAIVFSPETIKKDEFSIVDLEYLRQKSRVASTKDFRITVPEAHLADKLNQVIMSVSEDDSLLTFSQRLGPFLSLQDL